MDKTEAAQGPSDLIRVVYIMGCGRSGSTMLGAMLGNHPEIESPGELCYCADKAYLKGAYCACGQWGFACPFWSEVRRHWADRTGVSDVQRYASLVRSVEARRLWLSRLTNERFRLGAEFQEYAELTQALLQSLRSVSGRPIVVDASKRPARALLLSMMPQIDLRVIHLVRDCRGAVWSAKKRLKKDERSGVSTEDPGKSVYRATMIWTAGNLLSSWVRRRLDVSRWIRVRYEDYVTRPAHTLAEIGRLIEADLSPLAAAIAAGQPLSSGHTIAGNRLRMSAGLQLRADMEWMENLSAWDQRVCWWIGGRLLREHGYPRHPETAVASAARRAA